jgi:hypothetical protein
VATVGELLHSAAMGRVGVDRRFVRSVLENGDAAAVLRFASVPQDDHRIDLDPLLIDLFRHYGSPDALEFYLGAIRRAPEDIPDELVQALLPFRDKAIGPLLELYEELGEERGSDVAFLLAGLRVREPRVLAVLLDRLEYDAADGAFCLGLYGDPAARPALEKMLAEVPEEDSELRREIAHAIEELDAPEPQYQAEAPDILADYQERALPAFDLLPEAEILEMFDSEDPAVRAGAAHSFFNADLNAKSRAALFAAAKSDSDPAVRARSWESLGAVVEEEAAVRDALIAVLNDPSKPIEERGGAAVGLYSIADRDVVRQGIEALYELGGRARKKALEAMWRSLWEPYAKYFPPHLDDRDPKILREALRGAGYFQLTGYADKIAQYFDRDEPYADLREDALFAYAMAMPGETTRGRIRGMLRKIDSLAALTQSELQLVEFGLDERLRLNGLAPVFSAEQEEPLPEPPKVGRNDPCPCGSGKKYKKCCGAGPRPAR